MPIVHVILASIGLIFWSILCFSMVREKGLSALLGCLALLAILFVSIEINSFIMRYKIRFYETVFFRLGDGALQGDNAGVLRRLTAFRENSNNDNFEQAFSSLHKELALISWEDSSTPSSAKEAAESEVSRTDQEKRKNPRLQVLFPAYGIAAIFSFLTFCILCVLLAKKKEKKKRKKLNIANCFMLLGIIIAANLTTFSIAGCEVCQHKLALYTLGERAWQRDNENVLNAFVAYRKDVVSADKSARGKALSVFMKNLKKRPPESQ